MISGSSSTLILLEETMLGPKGLQPSTFEGGLDDLESFQAWAEEIRTYMSSTNPPLYEVLGQTASSKVPSMRMGWLQLRKMCFMKSTELYVCYKLR